jgi:putative flippase GtrA
MGRTWNIAIFNTKIALGQSNSRREIVLMSKITHFNVSYWYFVWVIIIFDCHLYSLLVNKLYENFMAINCTFLLRYVFCLWPKILGELQLVVSAVG